MIATTPHPVVLRSNELTIRTATQSLEISQLRAVLDEQHYLKAGRPAGHVLHQGILAMIRSDEHDSHNQVFLHYADQRSEALRLLTQKPPYNS